MKEINNLQEAVSLTLREARADAKISQRKLAEKIGCSRSYIDSLESGKYQPSLNAFIILANELGLTEEELLRRVKCNLLLLGPHLSPLKSILATKVQDA